MIPVRGRYVERQGRMSRENLGAGEPRSHRRGFPQTIVGLCAYCLSSCLMSIRSNLKHSTRFKFPVTLFYLFPQISIITFVAPIIVVVGIKIKVLSKLLTHAVQIPKAVLPHEPPPGAKVGDVAHAE